MNPLQILIAYLAASAVAAPVALAFIWCAANADRTDALQRARRDGLKRSGEAQNVIHRGSF